MSAPLETVAGRYRLTSVVGKGGMGSVWRGEHMSLGTPVAIKLLDPRLAEKEVVRARFLREARAAAALRSKHVVQIFDHGIEDGTPYIVMELLSGESLGERLARERRLPPSEVAKIFGQIGAAVARAHKAGVIHRDLKPDNVFLATPEEDEAGDDAWTVKVVDFGVAKLLDDTLTGDVSTETGSMLGTPHYMSPEQARGLKTIDARADLWAMAVIAFECLLGERPFRADTLGELVLRLCAEAPPVPSSLGPVPEGFDAWFAKATRKQLDQRFQDAGELVRELCEVLTPGASMTALPRPEPSSPGRPSRPESAGSPKSTSLELDATIAAGQTTVKAASAESPLRRRWALGAAVGLAIAGVAAALTLSRDRTESPAAGAQPSGISAAASTSGAAAGASAAEGNGPTILGIARPSSCKSAAADAYMKGLEGLRLADWGVAEGHLDEALKADPECAPPAVLLLALAPRAQNTANLDGTRALYRRLAPRKSELSPHDLTLMEAMEPFLLRDPPDGQEMSARLRAGVERLHSAPLMALFAATSLRSDPAEMLRLADRALEAEPRYADALQVRAQALDALGREREASAALSRCIEVAPASQCRFDHLSALSWAGQCEALEKEARAYLLSSGGAENVYELLGRTLAARAAPDEAVMEAFRQQASKLGGDLGPLFLTSNGAYLDAQRGRFGAAAEKARALAEQVEGSPAAFPHELAARLHAELLFEAEQRSELKAFSRSFFDKHPLWTPHPKIDRATPALVFALQELGEVPADEGRRRIDVWREVGQQKSTDPLEVWALRASCATTSEEARRLLAEAPQTLTLRWRAFFVEAMKGRLKIAVGAVEEAKQHLTKATHTCLAPSDPFVYVRAHLWLGQAHELAGDKPAACKAYARVEELWGKSKPLPRTARQAAERAAALKCSLE